MYNKELESRIKSGIRNGDIHSFKLLYEKFYTGMCLFAQRFSGQPEVAEEIVQDIFLKIWENRRKIEIRESLHSYLFTSVKNSCLNHLKHIRVEQKFNKNQVRKMQQSINYLHISQVDGYSLIVSEEMEKSLVKALENLPPKCREIFILHRKEGLKHSEIAKKMGISKNTVQRQISIALKKLREELKHLFNR